MSNRARRPAAVVSGALLVGALALAGCGRGSAPQPVATGAALGGSAGPTAPGPSIAGPTLPTLPPVQQRAPELFDAQGCARTDANASSCSSTASQLDQAQAAPGPGQRLAGYVGGAYATAAPTGTVEVLASSVATAAGADGRWTATGLVRNQRADLIGGATVHADLLTADGAVLETVTVDAPVGSLRPGEPAPFSAQAATTLGSAVASVRWSAEPRPGSADPSTRDIELQTYWTRRPTDARTIDNYLFHDDPTATGSRPLVVFGSVTNEGSTAVAHPHVVAAWSDASGRVVLVRDVPVSLSTGDPAPDLAAGRADDFLASVPTGSLPPGVVLDAPMLWGAGS